MCPSDRKHPSEDPDLRLVAQGPPQVSVENENLSLLF
jgi:hypothetical protein